MGDFGLGCGAGWTKRRLRMMLGGVALSACLCGQAGRGQAAPGAGTAGGAANAGTSPTLHAEARLVSVPVVVRDKKGALVKGLTKSDFTLAVDGQVQTIRYFDLDKDAPLVLGLLVDTSMSQRAVLDDERVASTAFLEQMLTRQASAGVAGDKAFVLQFAHESELLADVTESKPKLQAALKEIDASGAGGGGRNDPPDDSGNGNGNGNGNGQDGNGGQGRHGGRGGYGGHGGGGTVLYDAVYLGSNEVMAKQKGRKALVILSDGDDRGSKETLAKAIEAAQRADTVVYAIYFKGQEHGGFGDHGGGYGGHGGGGGRGGGGYPGGGGNGGGGYPGGGRRDDQVDGKKVLQRMCEETGGRLFEVKGKQTVATIYAEIGDELRSQYRLGYSPDAANAAEGYHKVEVTVPSQAKDSVQARDGYYGK